jgi:hypothetical protein
MGDKDLVKIYLGHLSDEGLTNIVRELKDILRPFETITPAPIMKMTRDRNEQYYIHLNNKALTQIIRHIHLVPPTVPFLSESQNKPMPPDFALKSDVKSGLNLSDYPI